MVNYKINNLKIHNPTINKILREDRYDADDVLEAEKKYIMRHTPPQRAFRVDLKAGDLVVVLEGAYMGKRVVFIKQCPEYKALVSGISSINGVSAFKVDERYLLKLGTSIQIPSTINIDIETVCESKINEAEKVDAEPTTEELELEKHLLASASKIPYMKAYLAEPFKLDENAEFYSQEY
ncbi:60S ribosomal protein L6 [Glugoides intestinalis]